MPDGATIEALLAEGRTFPPPPEFKKTARIVDAEIYEEAERDFEGFWARQAAELVDWIDELLRNVAEDEQLGDTTTLADPTVVEGIKDRYLATQGAGDEE
jgi:hypothetical protein